MSIVRITDNSKLVAAARTVVLLGSVLPFLGILGHGFIAVDDQIHTYLNPFLNGRAAGSVWNFWSSAYWGLYMPVTYTVWACISALARSGTTWNALPYHSANLVLHALNGLLAFELLRYLLLSIPSSSPSARQLSPKRSRKAIISDPGKDLRTVIAAVMGALFFALHPLQVEPVAWVSGLKDVLCGTFSLLFLLAFLRSVPRQEEGGRLRFVASLAFMALAVLSKPSAIILPLLGFVLSFMIGQPASRARWMSRTAVAVLFISAPVILVTSRAQPIPEGNFVAPLWARPLVAMDALAFYVYKTFLPVGFTLSYGRSPRVVLSSHAWAYWTWIVPAALALSLGMGSWKNRRRWGLVRVSLIGFLFFCLGFLPVLGLVPFYYQIFSTVSDRYAYLSLLGPGLIISFIVSRVWAPRWDRLVVGAVIVLIAGLGAISYLQTAYWHDTLTIAKHMLEVEPDNEMSQSTAGEAEIVAGDLQRAATHLEQSLRFCEPSQISNLSFELGLVRHLEGRTSEAAELYNKAISLTPYAAGPQNNLGVILLMEGKQAEAISHFVAATRFDLLLSAEPYFNLAKAMKQRPGEAEKVRALVDLSTKLQPGIAQDESSLLWRLRQRKPENISFNTELRLMWPAGYPVPGAPHGY